MKLQSRVYDLYFGEQNKKQEQQQKGNQWNRRRVPSTGRQARRCRASDLEPRRGLTAPGASPEPWHSRRGVRAAGLLLRVIALSDPTGPVPRRAGQPGFRQDQGIGAHASSGNGNLIFQVEF